MASKTISLSLESYQRLKDARLHSTESFSSVVKRARWDQKAPMTDGRTILAYYEDLEKGAGIRYLDEQDLDAISRRAGEGRTIRDQSSWED